MSTEEQFAQFQQFLAMQEAANGEAAAAVDKVTAAKLKDAPKPRTQVAREQRAATIAKATKVSRIPEPVVLDVDDEHAFVVKAAGFAGLTTRGSRVTPTVSGKSAKSLDVGMLRALQGDGVIEELIAAIDKLDKSAKIGAYRVAKEEAPA